MSNLQTALLSIGVVPRNNNSSTPDVDYFIKRYGYRPHNTITECMRNVRCTNTAGVRKFCY